MNLLKTIMGLSLVASLMQISKGAELNNLTIDEIRQANFTSTIASATRDLLQRKIPRVLAVTMTLGVVRHGQIVRDVGDLLENFSKKTTASLLEIMHTCMQYDDIPLYPDVLNYELNKHKEISDAMRENFDSNILPNIRITLIGNQRHEMIDKYFRGVEYSLIRGSYVTRLMLVNTGYFNGVMANT